MPDPTREIPKAMRMTIYIGGAASILVCLSLLLAVKDFGAIISGEDADPVMTILNDVFGVTGTKFVLVVVMISFLSCTLSLMAAASRLMYSYARDDMIFGSHLLRHFDQVRHVPPYAMIVAASCPPSIVLGSVVSTKALTSIVSFAILGIYLGFQMVVLAALRARLKGWVPSGPFTLGRWGMPITIAALTYGVLTMINVAWPRTPDAPWYDNWLVALSAVVGVGVGAIYMVIAKPYLRSEATSADAIPTLSGRPPTLGPSLGEADERKEDNDEVQLCDASRRTRSSESLGVDQVGRRARVPRGVRRGRDLVEGPLAALRRRGGRHLPDPDGTRASPAWCCASPR